MEETRVETLDGEAFPVPVKVTLGRAIRPVWDSVAAYPEAVLFIVLFVHFAAFSTLAIITHPTLDLDVIEQISWARNIEWGYYKHPPLPAWSLAALLTLTGGHPWIGAIAGPAAATLGLWLVWLLARRILDPARALPAVLLLEGVVYFNVLSLEFNHNVIQLPLWAFIAYASHRAIREGRTQDWLLFGFAAALGMLGKYSTALLLLSIGGYILFDPVARQHLTRKGPWIAVLTGTLLLIPHMNAVYAYNFSPLLTPSNELLIAASFWQRFGFPAGWLLAQLGDIAAALILAAVLFTGRATKIRVPGSEVARADRNFILFLFLGPLLFAVAFQGLGGVRFRDMWGFPMFDFLGLDIMALTATNALFQERIKRFAFAGMGVFTLAVTATAAMIAGAPYFLHQGGRAQYPSQAAASAIAKAWDTQTEGRPLKIVIGETWLAGMLSVYHPDHPSLLIDGEWWKSPWIHKSQLSEDGAVLIWDVRKEDLHQALLSAFPGAIDQPKLSLPYVTGAEVPPARLGWAILKPTQQASGHLAERDASTLDTPHL
ncbi:MAG: glycosyltransferase family 39 protein [Rhodomicrobium sp.]